MQILQEQNICPPTPPSFFFKKKSDFVRKFLHYYEVVRLPNNCTFWLRRIDFPSSCFILIILLKKNIIKRIIWISRVPHKRHNHMHEVYDCEELEFDWPVHSSNPILPSHSANLVSTLKLGFRSSILSL